MGLEHHGGKNPKGRPSGLRSCRMTGEGLNRGTAPLLFPSPPRPERTALKNFRFLDLAVKANGTFVVKITVRPEP